MPYCNVMVTIKNEQRNSRKLKREHSKATETQRQPTDSEKKAAQQSKRPGFTISAAQIKYLAKPETHSRFKRKYCTVIKYNANHHYYYCNSR